MMAAIFGTYAVLIWLVFAKLKLIRLSLPLAIILALLSAPCSPSTSYCR